MEEQKRSESEEFLTERDCLKKYNIRLLIISRGRSETITTHKIMPDWVEILVPETEKEKYKNTVQNPLLTVPDEIMGLGLLRNWVLDHFPEETVIMMDDDIVRVYDLCGKKSKAIRDKEQVIQILINTAIMAKDAGVHCFGFSQTDIRKYNGNDPFKLSSWVGCVIGVIGRRYRFRNDKYKVDIDFCLQNLLVDRIIWQDSRYLFSQYRDNNVVGCSIFRTENDFQQSVMTLQEKWGGAIKVRDYKNQIRISINVPRKQTIRI